MLMEREMTNIQEFILNHHQINLIIKSLKLNNNKEEEIQILVEMFELSLLQKEKVLNDFVTEY
jgi:hypothetical protein